ncbi:Uncharacterized protein Rs2_36045 [Raphanus sativus]|nr:Uncharacterized protein Rs2_36045 [Raphanus sativus]
MAACPTSSSSMDTDRDESQSTPKSSDVVSGIESDLQHVSLPDPRWPYLGRWSANQKAVSPMLPFSSEEESHAAAPSATIALPPVTTDPPPSSVAVEPPPACEIADTSASVTINLPSALLIESAPLTDELIDVNEEALPLVSTGHDEVSEKGDLDEEPTKETEHEPPFSSLTSECVTVPVHDSPSKSLASVITVIADDDSSTKLSPSVIFDSHSHDVCFDTETILARSQKPTAACP